MLQQLGISSSIKTRKHNNPEQHGYGNISYSVTITNIKDHNKLLSMFNEDVEVFKTSKTYSRGKTTEDFQLLKVRGVKEIDYNGDVCNIGVEGDNSYICENTAVHNCLPALEATRMGLPLIAPDHTGFSDYVRQDNAYVIDVDEWVVCNTQPEWSGWVTNQFFGQEFPKFGDTVVDQTASHMRHVMNNKEESAEKNRKLNSVIDEKYTWDKSISAAEERLLEICQ